ncbi:Anaerobic ribonucleoside-triphosphate reductase [Pelotomaculum sp. FP]|uniref:anaerobic ribonucleoside-triphosphate reductase n=1 Tax=Pelotomaculum sp. FP TaxID=261474 RepID=UPI00110459E1|nr:anaerobic ribonucleoside-triphosphate reductase [Pelotomaculum sp. FP]TEB17981.1 Anaerobic ribonucleoside-triphosphate reductase [Pelotomaculum sp. FP]
MFKTIQKRDGRIVPFDESKITDAIFKAAMAVGGEDRQTAMELTIEVLKLLKKQYNGNLFGVEDVQDLVEKVLIEAGHARTAKAYILHRDRRTRMRDAKGELMDAVEEILEETNRENANISNSPSAKMLQIASAASKRYYLTRLIPEEMSLAHQRGDLHIHDLDFYGKTLTCVPDFEYTLIRDSQGEVKRVKFDFFNCLIDKLDINVNVIEGAEVLDLDGYQILGRSGWTKINSVMRRKLREGENLYRIKTRKGLPLHLTGEHKVPVLRFGKEILVQAKNIKKGDQLLNGAREFEESSEIPVLDLFVAKRKEIPYGITIRNAQKLIHWLRYKYDDFKFKLTVGTKQSSKGGNFLSGDEYAKLAETYYIPYEVKQQLTVTTTKGNKSLPAYLPITPELMRLLGYILSEGHINIATSNRSIAIVNQSPDIQADIEHCVNNVFNDRTTVLYTSNLRDKQKGRLLNGSVYTALFRYVLGAKTNAFNIDIPNFVINASTQLKAHFLQGLFDGDGHYGEKRIAYSTVSEQLARKLSLLLQSIGVETTLYHRETKGTGVVVNGNVVTTRNYDSYTLNILETVSLQNFFDKVQSLKDNSKTKDYAFSVPGRNLCPQDVVAVDEVTGYDRYVFDLETAEHWFTVNDYVVHNCLQIPLYKLLSEGFNTGHGYIRPPKRPTTATAQAAIILQSSQNDMHGGQSYAFFDRDIAPFVQEASDSETYQAMEALIHNLNSMHSRAGAQVPFSSLNVGTETSEPARRVVKNLLLAYEAGLGHGENPIFPNIIFRVKDGINYNPGDPNYDLFKLALKVAGRRLNPTFSFMDSSFNREYGDQVSYMGCRTRVMANRRGPEVTDGRGNLSFTTINLPRVAIMAERDLSDFYRRLSAIMGLTVRQLYHRYGVQCKLKVKDMPFIMGQKLYLESEALKPDDPIEEAIKHGTLSLGFIGLAEALTALTGRHHGQSEESQALGLEIVAFMRQKIDEAAAEFDLNYTLLATPAEGLSGRFVNLDRKEFGLIPGVTNKEYYTNSFHVPVDFPVSSFDKILLEAPYHKYCNAGHISYVEMPSPPVHNLEAVETIIRHMHDHDMGYGGINYPVDFCVGCNLTGVFNEDNCPRCGSANIRRVRRITGYLSTTDRFNDSKLAELKDRVTHR